MPVIGTVGTQGAVGQPPQLLLPRGMQASPWSGTSVLVVDSGNNRVVEVDIASGLLAKASSLTRWSCTSYLFYTAVWCITPPFPHPRTGVGDKC